MTKTIKTLILPALFLISVAVFAVSLPTADALSVTSITREGTGCVMVRDKITVYFSGPTVGFDVDTMRASAGSASFFSNALNDHAVKFYFDPGLEQNSGISTLTPEIDGVPSSITLKVPFLGISDSTCPKVSQSKSKGKKSRKPKGFAEVKGEGRTQPPVLEYTVSTSEEDKAKQEIKRIKKELKKILRKIKSLRKKQSNNK